MRAAWNLAVCFAIAAALVLIGVGATYLAVDAGSLPTALGRIAGSSDHRSVRGFFSVMVGALLLLVSIVLGQFRPGGALAGQDSDDAPRPAGGEPAAETALEPTAAEPRPAGPQPGPTAAEPEPTAAEPEPTAAEPEPEPDPVPAVPEPARAAVQPEPTGPEPSPTGPGPERAAAQPELTTAEPEPAAVRPELTTAEPAAAAEPTGAEPQPPAGEPEYIERMDDEIETEWIMPREARHREERRAVEEAGGGESEGFEQAEAELIEHASHGDEHTTSRIMQDAVGPDEESVDSLSGEADAEHLPD